MNITQAQKLIETYNKVEEEQTQRLIQLYDFINARKGYRVVKFNRDLWSNCWGWGKDKPHAHEQFVTNLARPITEYVFGSEE